MEEDRLLAVCYDVNWAIFYVYCRRKWSKQSWRKRDASRWRKDERNGKGGARGNLPLSFVAGDPLFLGMTAVRGREVTFSLFKWSCRCSILPLSLSRHKSSLGSQR